MGLRGAPGLRGQPLPGVRRTDNPGLAGAVLGAAGRSLSNRREAAPPRAPGPRQWQRCRRQSWLGRGRVFLPGAPFPRSFPPRITTPDPDAQACSRASQILDPSGLLYFNCPPRPRSFPQGSPEDLGSASGSLGGLASGRPQVWTRRFGSGRGGAWGWGLVGQGGRSGCPPARADVRGLLGAARGGHQPAALGSPRCHRAEACSVGLAGLFMLRDAALF